MIIRTYYDDGANSDWEYDDFQLEATNDKNESRRFRIGRGEPEDMHLFRDLADALDVPELMKMAYEAGKNGEDFEIIEEDNEF